MATEILAMTEVEAAYGSARLAALQSAHEHARRLRERPAPDAAEADPAALAQALRRLGEVLGITAHELKAPLASSTLAVHLAACDLDTVLAHAAARGDTPATQLTAAQRHLQQAVDSLGRLDRLLGDLLDVAQLRADMPGPHLRLAPCDLAEVARAVVEEQRQLVPGRALCLRLQARPPAPVLADGEQIRRVVTNYLTNALRYAPAERPIDVRVRRRGDWVRVSVRDEGPGVARDERWRIWERFHRADGVSVTTGAGAGTGLGLGLGLHICKAIIERHHGRVGLRSAPGGGATFWFALPLLRSDGGARPRSGGGQLPAAVVGNASDGVAA